MLRYYINKRGKMKPVKVIQIGTAHDHASAAIKTLRALPDHFELIGICEPESEYLPKLKKSYYNDLKLYTLDEALKISDLEAVVIESSEETATHYAQLFADKGIHVYMDKPGTHGYDSFEKLVNTLRSKNLILHMGYMYRYNPMIKKSLEMVKSGELGEIYSVEAHMSVHHPKEKREWLSKHKGGMMYFLGCHDIDLVLQFMGAEPQEVISLNTATGQDGVECEDFGFAVLKYANGSSFVKSCAAEYNGYDRRQLVVCGTRGTIELRPIESKVKDQTQSVQKQYTRGRFTTDANELPCFSNCDEWEDSEAYDRYEELFKTFAEEVRGSRINPYTYDYELSLFRTLMKCCNYDN